MTPLVMKNTKPSACGGCFAAFECTAELNAELLQSAVSAVLVTRQAVRLQLKNGQIIGKEDLA